MPQAGQILSNMKRVTTTYDEELAVSPEAMDYYNSLAKDGDSTPEMEDAVDEAYVKAYAAAARARWKGQERWQGRENIERRIVNILHPHDVFRKLQRAGVDARMEAPTFDVWAIDDETGKPVKIQRTRATGRIWLHDESIRGRIGISARVWEPDKRQYRIKPVTWLQYPCGPEWSLMYFDEWNVPISERYRGWRTALLQMILKNVITEEEVDRAFGPVVLNPASELYRQQLQSYRARRRGLIQ